MRPSGDKVGASAVGAGDQDVAGAGEKALGDGDHLLGCFAFGEDDFGHAVAERAMMVDFGEAQIFKGQVAKALDGAIDIHFPRAHLFEQRPELVLIHDHRISAVQV